MHRWVVLVVLVACDPPVEPGVAPARWLVAAAPTAWPLGESRGRIGRSVAPDPAASRSIGGGYASPLVTPTPWTVPGDGPARAIVSGLDGGKWAVELVEVDAGHVAWRDTTACAGPVVGVTADAVVCSDTTGTRAIGLDGKPRWHSDQTFLAITNDDVITATAGTSVAIHAASTGTEKSIVDLPAGFSVDMVIATCAGDVFAATPDGKLARIAPAPGRHPDPGPIQRTPQKKPPEHKPLWVVPVGSVAAIDACAPGGVIDVTVATPTGTSLIAVAGDTGKLLGRVDGVHGFWPAREDPARIEIATSAGVARWPRELIANQPLPLPPLGELLARRGERRLVRATALTAALIDRTGVRAYVPLAELGAVLGDDAILAASWVGSAHWTPRLVAIPRPWRRPLRVPAKHAAVAVPAELRDLPQAVPLDVTGAVALGDAARFSVAAIAIDADPGAAAVYATTLEHAPDLDGHAGIARFDLAARAWRWHRADACGAGDPIAIAAAHDIVACAARGTSSTVRATARDGAAMWEWTAPDIDALAAGADIVLAFDADRLVVLDATNGAPLGTIASSDGGRVRAAVLDLAGMAMVVTYEQGRVVARLPHVAMVPAWSIAVDGVVRELHAAGDGVLVALEDGDAYRIDARTAVAVAVPGLDLAWGASPDLVTGEGAGGPVPPAKLPAPPKIVEVYHAVDLAVAPAIATPWPPPPPMADSWQITLYEPSGGLRARNDYAMQPPITPGARGRGAPLVFAFGPLGRELLVIEPERGDPVRHVMLPVDAPAANVTFAASVDGRPVVGTILAAPLRAVVF